MWTVFSASFGIFKCDNCKAKTKSGHSWWIFRDNHQLDQAKIEIATFPLDTAEATIVI